MNTLMICTTLPSARTVLDDLPEGDRTHAVILVHEAVIATPEDLGMPRTGVFASAEDMKALGCDSHWASVDAMAFVQMIANAQQVYVR
ncbi:hypothetical protein [Thermithiobacillus plumbiphilus]|uniref:Sulfur relay protein TusB/DsrH n=1 Tax=Thermithiobacillus plumbiphilus TaxID=1729899 RepID=A0ABU9D710_9PROT